VLFGILGKKATAVYLASIALMAVLFGLAVDQIYTAFGFSGKAMVGQAAELVPVWAQWLGAITLLTLSVKPVFQTLKKKLSFLSKASQTPAGSPDLQDPQSAAASSCADASCGCESETGHG